MVLMMRPPGYKERSDCFISSFPLIWMGGLWSLSSSLIEVACADVTSAPLDMRINKGNALIMPEDKGVRVVLSVFNLSGPLYVLVNEKSEETHDSINE
ncbi:hypothetical protein [Chimaeribacter californicus]|uniref:hypothetical protein n=1 Tax=Chimaeribacter californicus TaxID=2060067 RepID=UPI0011AF3594|nr:hypothetical protein [Chimaeribacter californicus]